MGYIKKNPGTTTFKETTVDSEMLYAGKILNLRRDKVNVPGGNTAAREIVEHHGGVTVAALTPEGRLVLIKQFRKAAKKDVLELPAGKLEKGEEPLEAAIRELKEETGYTAGRIELLSRFYAAIGYSEEIIHLYFATDLVPGEVEFDTDEAIEILEYDLDDAVRMCFSGEIEDSKTLVGVLMVKKMYENH